MYLRVGKLNVGPIDSSHGSSGKGKVADYLSCVSDEKRLDFAISHNSQNACLTEGHKVYTNKGIVDIVDVVSDEDVTEVFVGGKFYKITDKFNVGTRPVCVVTLHNGMEFSGTDNHQFKVWDGKEGCLKWVRIDELDSDIHQFVFPKNFPDLYPEYVQTGYETRKGIPNGKSLLWNPEIIDEKLAFIMGMMVGDGNYNCQRRLSLAMAHGQEENTKIFVEYLDSLGVYSQVYQIINKKAVSINVSSAEMIRLFRAVGLESVCGAQKKIPEAIFRSPKSVIQSFLAGLVESDGSVRLNGVGCKDGRINVVSNISFDVVSGAQTLCTYLGLRTKVRSIDTAKRNEKTGVNRKTCYHLDVNNYNSLLKFYEEIPLTTKKPLLKELIESRHGSSNLKYDSRVNFGGSTKNDSLLIRNNHPQSSFIKDHYFVDIQCVEPAEPTEVYDFTVEEVHAYTCEGTVSHNSHVTVFDDGTEYKFNFLPSSVANEGTKVVIGADAVISVDKALEEIRDWGLDETSLFIHPLVTIIEPDDVDFEVENLAFLGSTMTGGGAAKSKKILRLKNFFAKDHPDLKKYVTNTHSLVNDWLKQGKTGLCEAAQGYDLSQDVIWTGLDGEVKTMYPFCTSRNINPAAYMGYSFVPPQLLGNTILNLRCYGIRVGDSTTVQGDFVVKMKDGSEKGMFFSDFGLSAVPSITQIQAKFPEATHVLKLGSSGHVYDDQEELSWEEITTRSGSPVPILEQTSLTKRIRRVFDRSLLQLQNSTMVCMPNIISCNFVNYLDHNISDKSGKMTLAQLSEDYPKVYEYVKWVEDNQYWVNTKHAGKVMLLGTGASRSAMIQLTR